MSAARDNVVKKKQVRFASMEDDDDNDDQEEDTLFDKSKDAGRRLKSALKAAKRTTKPGCDERVEVVGGGRRGNGACGRWMVTLVLCASFLGLVNLGSELKLTLIVAFFYRTKYSVKMKKCHPRDSLS